MKIHFIAIGGSAMHSLAIALKQKGYTVSGSDDEIFEPSRSRLRNHNLLPKSIGWNPERITPDIDAVVLGMHARADNPELAKAKELGVKIYSYPEYLYEQTKGKTRVVVGGSHGKTTITSMIMHVLKHAGIKFDYMVGAKIEGFDNMVGLSEETEIAIFEGDEYLTSPIDPRPKFLLYKPHIAVLSGIAWDHINVFPTFDIYLKQFEIFTQTIMPNGQLIYCDNDRYVKQIAEMVKGQIGKIPYTAHAHHVDMEEAYLDTEQGEVKLKILGGHNMENISAAKEACAQLGVCDEQFYQSISSFTGAAKRMQILERGETTDVFLDFAHAPSKVKATVSALKESYPYRRLVACLELHTFSSLNTAFLSQYKDSMCNADTSIVFYSPKTIEHKKLPPLNYEEVKKGFGCSDLQIFTDVDALEKYLLEHFWDNTNLLLMSSGIFMGLDIKILAKKITDDDSFPRRYLDV